MYLSSLNSPLSSFKGEVNKVVKIRQYLMETAKLKKFAQLIRSAFKDV